MIFICGRYNIEIENNDILEIINAVNKNLNYPEIKTGEIFPTNNVPVLLSKNNTTEPDLLKWGYPNFRNKGVIINARSETAIEKKTFRESLFIRRCIVPTTGFYEWDKSKQKYLFNLPNEKSLYLAGLYNEYKDEKCFVIITTAANFSISDIHERMPVIIEKSNINNWLQNTDFAMNILHSIPPMLVKSAV